MCAAGEQELQFGGREIALRADKPAGCGGRRALCAQSSQDLAHGLRLRHERGHKDLLMNVDDPDLAERTLTALEILDRDGERIADGIARTVVRNLKLMARMGVYFEEEVQRRYPDFPTRRGEWSWEDYLPPMSGTLRALVKAYS